MADTKVSGLTRLTDPVRGDIVYVVDDPSGTPISKYMTIEDGIAGPSILVAASDATTNEIKHADYICDGTNDEVQIQAAIDALPATGGTVGLLSGTFNINQVGAGPLPATPYCVIIDENDGPIALVGRPGATKVFLVAGQPMNTAGVLVCGSDDGAGKRINPTWIQGIEFDGNDANQGPGWGDFGLVHTNYANWVTVQGCYVHDAEVYGVQALRNSQYFRAFNNRIAVGSNAGLRVESPNCIVTNNIFIGDNAIVYPGLMMAANTDIGVVADYSITTNNLFVGGRYQFIFGGCRYGVIAQNTFSAQTWASGYALGLLSMTNYEATDNLICNNVFHDIPLAVRSYTANAGWGGTRNRILNNTIIEGAGVNLAIGIQIDGADNEYNEIIGNLIRNATTAISDTGTGTVIRDNTGYVTENDGAAAAVADGGTIAHGCAATPTSAQVTGSVANEFASVTGIGAANLTVAIKKHDGTPGTAQTIYWRAWV